MSKKIEGFDNPQEDVGVEVKHVSSLFSENCISHFCWEFLDKRRFEILSY